VIGVERVLVPEILDGLAHDDARAVRSRGDLARINWLMGQARITAGLLCRHLPPGPGLRLLEVGAGDATPALRLARRLAPARPGARLVLLDMAPAFRADALAGIRALGWSVETVAADAFDWLGRAGAPFDAALCNLFLHHFEGIALARLMTLLARRARLLVATEPRRDRLSLWAARATPLIGSGTVTRHDAPASVRAGFREGELGAPWREAGSEVLFEGRRGLFTHAFAGRAAR
jgi:SAM-dependent methyltransferase